MPIRTPAHAVRRLAVPIASVAIICAAIGGLSPLALPPNYKAESSVIVAARLSGNSPNAAQLSSYTQGMMETFSGLATKQLVLAPVAEDLDDGTPWMTLQSKVDAEVPIGSTLIDITVSDSSPARAARIANLVSAQLELTIPQVTPEISGRSALTVTQTSEAIAPAARGPAIFVEGGLWGLLVGAVVGALIARLLWKAGYGSTDSSPEPWPEL